MKHCKYVFDSYAMKHCNSKNCWCRCNKTLQFQLIVQGSDSYVQRFVVIWSTPLGLSDQAMCSGPFVLYLIILTLNISFEIIEYDGKIEIIFTALNN